MSAISTNATYSAMNADVAWMYMIFCAAPCRASIGVKASARTYTSGDAEERDAERVDRAATGCGGETDGCPEVIRRE